MKQRKALIGPVLAVVAFALPVAVASTADAAAGCPAKWTRADTTPDPGSVGLEPDVGASWAAKAQRVDADGDGAVCIKAAKGGGNTGKGWNVKDDA